MFSGISSYSLKLNHIQRIFNVFERNVSPGTLVFLGPREHYSRSKKHPKWFGQKWCSIEIYQDMLQSLCKRDSKAPFACLAWDRKQMFTNSLFDNPF